MAKNEAKIKFTAETGDFNKAIQKSNSEMSELRAEMKLNETQMKSTGTTVESLEKKHDILEKQLKASQDKTEALNQKHQKAVEIFGENSQEASKLKVQLLNAETAEEKLRQALAQCADELSELNEESQDSRNALEKLNDTVEEQQSELDKLKREYVDAAIQHGKNSKEAKDLAKQIENLSGELKDNKKDLADAEEAADKFDKSLDEAGDSADEFNGKLAGVAVGVTAAAAALVEFGSSAMEAFNEVDEGADNVIKATGATGEQAKELEESYSNVAKQVVGDFGNIGSALGEVNTRFGYTGKELEDASIKFQKFSEITGVDSTEAVKSVSRALNDAGIPLSEYDTLLDQLAKAGQSAGIDVTTLADSLSKNGTVMRNMGFDTQETIALLAQFELSGADTATMLAGMKKGMAAWSKEGKDGSKEFANLVSGLKDGSKDASDAIDVFGSKAGPMLVDAIKSGKFEYEDMLKVIQDSKGTVESTFDGTVDGGYEMELAMQNCKIALAEVGEVVGTAMTPVFQEMSETIIPALVDGFGAMVEGVQSAVSWMGEHKGVMIAIASVVGVLATAITAYNVVQGIKTAMDAANVTTVWALVAAHWAQAAAAMAAIAPYVLVVAAIAAVIAIIVLCVKYWDEIVAAVKRCWDSICATLAKWGEWINTNVIQPIGKFFSNLWDGVVNVVKTAWEWIKNAVSTAINAVKNVISTVMNAIQTVFTTIWNAIKTAVTTVVDAIKSVITNVWEGIKTATSTAFNAVKSVVTSVWNGIKTAISNVVNGVKNTVSNIWNGIKTTTSNVFNSVKSTVTNVWNNIKNAILTPIEAAKDKIKGIVDSIKGFFSNMKISLPKIKLPHFKITGKLSISPPSVPKLTIDWYKDGGIFTKPTIFSTATGLKGVGEAGAEAVLPIDKLEGYISNAIEKAQNVVNFDTLAAAIEDLANRPAIFRVGDRDIAIATASANDSVSGLRSTFKSRGLALE